VAEIKSQIRIIVADPNRQSRVLTSDVLRGAGYLMLLPASTSDELMKLIEEYQPRIVLMTAQFPGMSGLDFTRMIRAGHNFVPRELSIILSTIAPTKTFLDAAQEVGVDELVVMPFTAQSLIVRIRSVIERPRPFIDSVTYVGPSRRRRMVDDYKGPLRRFIDPTEDMVGAALWEKESNRSAVRLCVQRISEFGSVLTPGDRRKLREIYNSAMQTETLASQTNDDALGNAARSLGRYIAAIGANGVPDAEVISTHVDAMHSLGTLTSAQHEERQKVIDGLRKMVQQKLGRQAA
jgi:CheY-like chemotaxis protein